jgi:hypothetical protein
MQSSEAGRTTETAECHMTMAAIANRLIAAILVGLMYAETSAMLRSGNIFGPNHGRKCISVCKVHARDDNLGYVGYVS